MAEATMQRQEFVREALGEARDIVQKPLSKWERIYGQGWVRKLMLLVALAVIWEIYARFLENELLFPTFLVHHRRVVEGRVQRRAPVARRRVPQGPAHRLLDRHRARGAARHHRHHHAHRHRPAGDAHLDVQPVAGDRAAAARAHLVRAGHRKHRLRAGALGAVGRGAQHALGLPLGLDDACAWSGAITASRDSATSARS